MKNPIDRLVESRALKTTELQELGQLIAESSTPIVVAFIDLANSTQMKQEQAHDPAEWLGYVFQFIRKIT
jgi:hypothetical protein